MNRKGNSYRNGSCSFLARRCPYLGLRHDLADRWQIFMHFPKIRRSTFCKQHPTSRDFLLFSTREHSLIRYIFLTLDCKKTLQEQILSADYWRQICPQLHVDDKKYQAFAKVSTCKTMWLSPCIAKRTEKLHIWPSG